MSDIRVRRSGLVSFAIRLGSTITGLAFVVIVTSNLSPNDFGLWQLISRIVAYMVLVSVILGFWTTRYRARGMIIGRTVVAGALILSVFLTVIYFLISPLAANSVPRADTVASNLYYFLLSMPQIPLYVTVSTVEAILWGSQPTKASLGFGLFEIAKVAIAFVTVSILHLTLTGAILAVMGAQVVQLTTSCILARKDFRDRISLSLISTMFRNGWVAILNSLQPLVLNSDLVIVAAIAASLLPVAIFGAAYTLASVISYSGTIASGLYAGLLSGRDPRHSTMQVLELQYLFLFPMTAGEIVLATPLMHLLNKSYAIGGSILIVLAISQALYSISQTFDNVISGTDRIDAEGKASFSAYLKSKIFLVSKINLLIGLGYLAAVAIIASAFNGAPEDILGYSRYVLLGICWAFAALAMFAIIVALKVREVLKVSNLSIPGKTVLALLASTAVFSAVLFGLVNFAYYPSGGEISQALSILALGMIALVAYFACIFALSNNFRRLAKLTVNSIQESIFS